MALTPLTPLRLRHFETRFSLLHIHSTDLPGGRPEIHIPFIRWEIDIYSADGGITDKAWR
jgi:hypothetical protein